ncbi:MAG: hypothetical protein IH987_10560 [Planctomycetes bacterium]|nr:hypothetical protein [Planctomycetota bacterium]
MQVSTIKADCLTCGFWHYRPWLGDFSYGEGIAQGSFVTGTGETFAYLNVLNNSGWDRLRVLAEGLETDESFFQWLVDQCLDPISGVSLGSGVRCPECDSTDIKLHEGMPTGRVEIPEATFTGFLSLDPHEQQTRVVELHSVWGDEYQ